MSIQTKIALASFLGLYATAGHGQNIGAALSLTYQQLQEYHATNTGWRDTLTATGGKCVLVWDKAHTVQFAYFFLQGQVYRIQATGSQKDFAWVWRQVYEGSASKTGIDTWLDPDHHYRYRLTDNKQQGTSTLTVTDSRTNF